MKDADRLIKDLEEEHLLIQDLLVKLLETKKGCPADSLGLKELEALVVNHISREDVEIYKPLKKMASIKADARKFLEGSYRELENIKIFALVFFEKYRGEDQSALCGSFHKDLKKFSDKIHERMIVEDTQLFPFFKAGGSNG